MTDTLVEIKARRGLYSFLSQPEVIQADMGWLVGEVDRLRADLAAAERENAALRAFILKVEAAAQDWNHAMDADAFASEARALRGGKEGS